MRFNKISIKTTALLAFSLLLLWRCEKNSSVLSENNFFIQNPSSLNYREYIGVLDTIMHVVAKDPLFEDLLEQTAQTLSLIMLDSALNDSQTASDFFLDSYNIADTATHIKSFFPLMRSYGFGKDALKNFLTCNEKLEADMTELENTYLIGINATDRAYIIYGALDIYLDSPEATCCQAYRNALIRCAREATNYLTNIWAGVVNVVSGGLWPGAWGPGAVVIAAAGNPFQIANDVYPCIRAADATYQPCCN